MKFEEIENLWSEDAVIDRTNLAGAAVDQAKLHHKYWKILNEEKKRLIYLKADRTDLQDFLEYYYGDHANLTDEALQKYQRDVPNFAPFKVQTVLASKITKDPLMVDMVIKINLQEQKCEFLLDIIKCINGRSFQINAAAKVLEYSKGAT